MNRRPWTHEEINILRELYPNELISWVQILGKLKDRTLASCRLKAERLRLTRKRRSNDYEYLRRSARWAEIEKDILKSHPDLSKTKEGQRFLHNQVLDNIVRKMNPHLSEDKISDLIGKLTLKSKEWAEILEERSRKEEEMSKTVIGRRLLKYEKTGVIDIE